jgi:hypothetical protein
MFMDKYKNNLLDLDDINNQRLNLVENLHKFKNDIINIINDF